MKALVYHGPMDVRVDDKTKPKVQNPEDIVLRVTETAICGSDLHLFHGTMKSMDPYLIMLRALLKRPHKRAG